MMKMSVGHCPGTSDPFSSAHNGEGTTRAAQYAAAPTFPNHWNHFRQRRFCTGGHIRFGIESQVAVLLLFIFLAFASVASAQLPSARLMTLFPAGGQSGTTLNVAASGTDLDAITAIQFSHPGISGKLKDVSDSSTDRAFTITINADVPPGIYEGRIVARYGVTNPRAFVVSERAELPLPSKSVASGPIPLPLNCVGNGQCAANGVDFYTLELKQGRRTLIEVAARAIDSRLQPVLTLTGPDGHELARSRRDGLIDITAPSDGVFTLQLHDLLYRGGPEYFYRLVASSAPHLDLIFPPAGMPGSKGRYTLLGRNLPGGTLSAFTGADGKMLEQLEVEIELPADIDSTRKVDAMTLLGAAGAGLDAVSYRLKSDAGVSNPVLIGLTRMPMILREELKDSADKSQTISPPCEIAGRFYPHGHRDTFTFEAAKGDVYWMEIFSQRLGHPTCPELLVQKVTATPKGQPQVSEVQSMGGPDMQSTGKRGGGASAGFPTPSRDVEYRFEAKDAGTYRIIARDLFDETRDDATLVYRLSIHKESPDFRLVCTAAPVPDLKNNNNGIEPNLAPPFLRKGGVTPLRVNLFRQDGFDGDVHIEAQGLPPGVHCEATVIPSTETVATLLLSTDEDASGWNGSLRIIGKAQVANGEAVHEARIGTIVWPTQNANNNAERALSRLTDSLACSVSADEMEPLAIEIGNAHLESKAGAAVHVPVKIKRRIEMKQPLKLQIAGLPKSQGKAELTLAPDANDGILDLDLGQQKLAPGTYTFYLQTQVQMKYERVEGASEKVAAVEGKKTKKREAKDAQVVFYSTPITLTILPK